MFIWNVAKQKGQGCTHCNVWSLPSGWPTVLKAPQYCDQTDIRMQFEWTESVVLSLLEMGSSSLLQQHLVGEQVDVYIKILPMAALKSSTRRQEMNSRLWPRTQWQCLGGKQLNAKGLFNMLQSISLGWQMNLVVQAGGSWTQHVFWNLPDISWRRGEGK